MGSLESLCIHVGEEEEAEEQFLRGELVAEAWETRRLLGGLARTSLDLPWGFLPVFGSGLARV